MEQRTHTTPDGKTVIVLMPTGRLDITTAWQFRLKLQESISRLSPHIVVNLSQVNFIDSSGLTSLVAGMRDADKVKGSFRICNVHPEAKLVFEVTMMDSVFEIFETEEEALEGVPRSVATG
ncbi:MAG: STAS domain-containing protein [Cyanobacteriota bacterium]|jgi:anti-anti-sigma factor|uniref:Anti-sigma factor antagonist n=2 Tax=Thermoleptolyngbya TaxID=2303528 RepID=A0A6M8B9K3_9CYAN|nr:MULTISPECIES: STAS domain-containing protein [Thermoleptolyngbya]QKD81407.1 STAS domain-containing protein [Thermoleptolyngbya sichuanensis A183]WOB42161.1 STAS domain-containing protein [Thermoleptolyngbya oregonensis NK1-22]HIK41169.1 STAS domain-containing protein [Thermoleptolyngbya sp. M55_K2018_002]